MAAWCWLAKRPLYGIGRKTPGALARFRSRPGSEEEVHTLPRRVRDAKHGKASSRGCRSRLKRRLLSGRRKRNAGSG